MFFYLKVNSSNSYMLGNINKWLDSIVNFCISPTIYIVCDEQIIIDMIRKLSLVRQHPNIIHFIKSMRDNDKIQKIADKASSSLRWHRAACAHLTPFFHAYQNNITSFWNIDADDTFLFCSPQKQSEILKLAEKTASIKQIDGLSLDFWWTRSFQKHWTFGITFIQNVNKHIECLSRWISSNDLDNWITNEWKKLFAAPESIFINIPRILRNLF